MQKRFFLLAIALFILIPVTGVFTGLGAMNEQEMRDLEHRRKTAFGAHFPKWFTDNLGMRGLFLKAYSSVLLFVFGQSSNPHLVHVGQEGFLFLGDANLKTFSYHAGLPHTDDELLHLGEGFKNIIMLFEKKGIPVLLAIAPDKATIYGEYYPKWVKHVSRSLPREKLVASPLMKERVIFLEDILLEYKKHTDYLFWKNDTHWNRMGAYIGYMGLMDGIEKLLGKELKRVPSLGWKTHGASRGGDLKGFNRVAEDTDILYDLILPKEGPHKISGEKSEHFYKYSNKKASNTLNVAIIHDSFYYVIPPVYRRTFNTTYEIHIEAFDKEKIEALLRETPPLNLVIFLLVERSIPLQDNKLKRLAGELSPLAGPRPSTGKLPFPWPGRCLSGPRRPRVHGFHASGLCAVSDLQRKKPRDVAVRGKKPCAVSAAARRWPTA